jgi:hypothetical protein
MKLKEHLTSIFGVINSEYEKGHYKLNEAQQILKEKQLNLALSPTDFVSILVKK